MSDPSSRPPARPPVDPFPSDARLASPIPRRTPLLRDRRNAHRAARARLARVDAELVVLAARRRACLDELAEQRRHLTCRYATRHGGRRPSWVDEPPMPPAPVHAQLIGGVELRATALAVLRRYGPQRLRDLHGLLHCHGYVIAGRRPVQRLADALAYECAQDRAERIERGVYAALPFGTDRDADGEAGPARPSSSGGSPRPAEPTLGTPLPWTAPPTDDHPVPPDRPVAHDPELWTAGRWPTTPDPADIAAAPLDAARPHPTAVDPAAVDPAVLSAPAVPPAPATPPLGNDSPTNRRPRAGERRTGDGSGTEQEAGEAREGGEAGEGGPGRVG